jgi:4-diphosphocytidyl-2C-methyl-D-erythritol kinase
MSQSKTPRTDEAWDGYLVAPNMRSRYNTSVELEEELNQWKACAEELAKAVEQRVIPTGPCMFRYCDEHKQALATFNNLSKNETT